MTAGQKGLARASKLYFSKLFTHCSSRGEFVKIGALLALNDVKRCLRWHSCWPLPPQRAPLAGPCEPFLRRNNGLRRPLAQRRYGRSSRTPHAHHDRPASSGSRSCGGVATMTRGTGQSPNTQHRAAAAYRSAQNGLNRLFRRTKPARTEQSGTRFGRLYASWVPRNSAPGRCRHAA